MVTFFLVCYPDNWNCEPGLHQCVVHPVNEDLAICFCTDKDNCDSALVGEFLFMFGKQKQFK